MARIRMIKPEFFDDPVIAELSPMARLFYIGLWLQADRDGRLVDDCKRLKARIFPYEAADCDALANELDTLRLIRRYFASDERRYIWIRTFVKHQRPHPKEPESLIPPYVEKNGETRKKTEGTSESGSLVLDSGSLDSGIRNLEIRTAAAPQASHRLAVDNVKIITKIAHEVISGHNGNKPSGSDLCDEIKTLCAKRKIAYDAAVIRKALDSAEVQRKAKTA